MKKIFTLLFMSVFAIAANAITVYVQCETAPFIWSWGSSDGVDYNVGEWPGTNQLTETWVDPNSGDTFWKWEFPSTVTTISFKFNDGVSGGKETANIADNATTDRYFTLSWDDGEGNVVCEDITEQYIVIPDAEVNAIGVSGNHNGWADSENLFKAIGENQFQYSADVAALKDIIPATAEVEGGTETQIWQFKFRPNLIGWLGYWELYYGEETDPGDGRLPVAEETIDWLEEVEGNFAVDLINITDSYLTFTLTWAGGKDIVKGWTLAAEKGETNGITNVANKAKAGVKYNLAGQRVNNDYRGIVIENGRKYMVK
jgi:hypothetical protein